MRDSSPATAGQNDIVSWLLTFPENLDPSFVSPVFSMLFVIAFDFHVSERFKHFVERRKILAIARFIS